MSHLVSSSGEGRSDLLPAIGQGRSVRLGQRFRDRLCGAAPKRGGTPAAKTLPIEPFAPGRGRCSGSGTTCGPQAVPRLRRFQNSASTRKVTRCGGQAPTTARRSALTPDGVAVSVVVNLPSQQVLTARLPDASRRLGIASARSSRDTVQLSTNDRPKLINSAWQIA